MADHDRLGRIEALLGDVREQGAATGAKVDGMAQGMGRILDRLEDVAEFERNALVTDATITGEIAGLHERVARLEGGAPPLSPAAGAYVGGGAAGAAIWTVLQVAWGMLQAAWQGTDPPGG